MKELDITYLNLLEERLQKAQQDHQEALKLLNLSIMNLHGAQQSLEDFKSYLEYKNNTIKQKEGKAKDNVDEVEQQKNKLDTV